MSAMSERAAVIDELVAELPPSDLKALAERLASQIGYVLAPEPAHPDGPREADPTPEMIAAGDDEILKFLTNVRDIHGAESPALACYRAMRAAAPAIAREAPSAPVEAVAAQEAYHAEKIAELVEEGAGFWRPCSGCQEGEDGYVSTRDYPYNKTFRCQPGAGCRECGGLGVIWDDTDYDAMAKHILASDRDKVEPSATPQAVERPDRTQELLENASICIRAAMKADNLSDARAMMQAALDFTTNDTEALAEGATYASFQEVGR